MSWSPHFSTSLPRSPVLLGALLLALLAPVVPADAAKWPVTTVEFPAATGIILEVRTIFDAPAARVAQLAGDPASFLVIYPAEQAKVVGRRGAALLVDILFRQPWPMGLMRWTEAVTRRPGEDGEGYVIEREVLPGSAFRHLKAHWRIRPLPPAAGSPGGARCQVVYHVSMDLNRWAPKWMLRRGNESGMAGTMERLRRLSEAPLPDRDPRALTTTPAAPKNDAPANSPKTIDPTP